MSIYENVLAIIDSDSDELPALSRAVQLIEHQLVPAKLTLFLSIYDFSYEMTSMLSHDERETMRTSVLQDRKAWLSKVALPYIENLKVEVKLELNVVWHNRPYEAIIQEVFDQKFDLVVKSTHLHPMLESVIFTPTDWHLIRKCPCPVLLVKDHDWPIRGNILVSTHVGSENPVHHRLNEQMVTTALAIGKHFDATTYLANAYPTTPPNITMELPTFDPVKFSNTIRGHHLSKMKSLRQSFAIDEDFTRVEEGAPEDVIPDISKSLDAGLVILGTTGRTGLSAVFIGNTAEHVIDQIGCDILALKPEGYVSPLAPEALD